MRPGGVEPPAFWSVAKRSIQLSYGRVDTTTRYATGPEVFRHGVKGGATVASARAVTR